MLIFRIDPYAATNPKPQIVLPAHAVLADMITDRIGELVLLGARSHDNGWAVIATAVLMGKAETDEGLAILFKRRQVLDRPHILATVAPNDGDYAVEIVSPDALPGWLASELCDQSDDLPSLPGMEEAALVFLDSDYPDPSPQTKTAFHRIALAYGHTCAVSGLHLMCPKTGRLEGEVVTLDGKPLLPDTPNSGALFLTSTLAFCYQHHLLAIGEDFDILRHTKLPAELRILLEYTNRAGMMRLPADTRDRPDIGALRRHRQAAGF